MPFIELAVLVVCSTCAGFYFGQKLLEMPAVPEPQHDPDAEFRGERDVH